jgi:hypothetical protein
MQKKLIFLFLFFSFYSFSENFPYNPHVPIETWTVLEPYFLPFDHLLRKKLDRLFSKYRITQSLKNFEQGGFSRPKLRQPTNILVSRHLGFPHYLFKVYLDSQPALIEWDNWVKRIEGAQAIQECIKRHHFKHFVVPKKWIYPLPLHPAPSEEALYQRKNFLLIVEEIAILKHEENQRAYQKKMTSQVLDELFVILTEVGLIDSVYIDNIPFTADGKIAFIDTEHHHLQNVPYHKLMPYLNPKMQQYWKNLIASSIEN